MITKSVIKKITSYWFKKTTTQYQSIVPLGGPKNISPPILFHEICKFINCPVGQLMSHFFPTPSPRPFRFIYLFWERENPSSRIRTVSRELIQGSNSGTVRSWPEPKSRVRWARLSHPGAPEESFPSGIFPWTVTRQDSYLGHTINQSVDWNYNHWQL